MQRIWVKQWGYRKGPKEVFEPKNGMAELETCLIDGNLLEKINEQFIGFGRGAPHKPVMGAGGVPGITSITVGNP